MTTDSTYSFYLKPLCPNCGRDALRSIDELKVQCDECRWEGLLADGIVAARAKKPAAFDISDHPQLAAALGSLIAASSRMEARLGTIAMLLMRCADPIQAHITLFIHPTTSARLDVLTKLLENMPESESLKAEFSRLFLDVRSAISQRNKFAHSTWYRSADGTDILIRVDHGKPSKTRMEVVRIADLDGAREACMIAYNQMKDIFPRYIKAAPLLIDPVLPDPKNRVN